MGADLTDLLETARMRVPDVDDYERPDAMPDHRRNVGRVIDSSSRAPLAREEVERRPPVGDIASYYEGATQSGRRQGGGYFHHGIR